MEVVCMECQRGDYARGNRGRAGCSRAGRLYIGFYCLSISVFALTKG